MSEIAICGYHADGEPIGPHDNTGQGRCGCPPATNEMTCGRCKKPTGNANQGHYWAFCKVTKTDRTFHFCCPDDCELPTGAHPACRVKTPHQAHTFEAPIPGLSISISDIRCYGRPDSQCGTCGWMLSEHWIPDGACPEPSRTECGNCDIGAPMSCTCEKAPADPATPVTLRLGDLQVIFDLAVNSMDFGSGFWDNEDVESARKIAVAIGVNPMEAVPREFMGAYPHEFAPDTNNRVAGEWPGCRYCSRVRSAHP